MTDHTDLIARIKAATGPGDELNCEIARALGVSWSWDDDGNYGPYKILPRHCRFLSSLDAVLLTARNEDELRRMIMGVKKMLYSHMLLGSGPPSPMFELCRAAMLVRLGGE